MVGLLGTQMINNNKCKLKKETVSSVHQTNSFKKMRVISAVQKKARVNMTNKMALIQMRIKT